MGIAPNVAYGKFPRQGNMLHRRVLVCFNYDTAHPIGGTVVRDDCEEPYRTIIRLDDGRFVLGSECQYGEEA